MRLISRLALARRAGFFVSAVLVAPLPVPVVAETGPIQQQDRVVIDGSKNPEMFPQWYRWQITFEELISLSGKSLKEQLGLSDAELKIVTTEVAAYKQLRATLAKDVQRTRDAGVAEGKKQAEILDAIHVKDLEYRYGLFEVRDRIEGQIPAPRLFLFRRFMDGVIRGTTIYLSGRAIREFREPG